MKIKHLLKNRQLTREMSLFRYLAVIVVVLLNSNNLQVEGSFVAPQLRPLSRPCTPIPVVHQDSQSRKRDLVAVQAGREAEIRRKIAQLKREGKIKNQPSVPVDDGTRKSATPVAEQYGDRLRKKLGTKKAKLLGTTTLGTDEEDDRIIAELDEDEEEPVAVGGRKAQLGALSQQGEEGESSSKYVPSSGVQATEYKNFDASLFEEDDDDDEVELSEEDLVELVAEKLAEKRKQEAREKEAKMKEEARKRLAELEKERQELKQEEQAMVGKTTSGIGGRWIKKNETSSADYKPSKSGTWGVFERPKDISRAFGGGKRVGAGYTPDNLNKKKSEEETRARLQQYREKVGIDVQSEKDHAEEIEQALEIGRRAMEVGY